jgi:DNA-binding winged helix-turn-helix (wHTH) protein
LAISGSTSCVAACSTGQNQTVELSARLFDALVYFAEHRGELLDKDRLMAALWPGLVVEENNLNKVVSALRRALGDDGEDKRYLLTVPRRGFRFVADVRKVTASARPPLEPAAAAAATRRRPRPRSQRLSSRGAGAH